MKILKDLGIIIFPSPRSRAYLQAFKNANITPSQCLLIDTPCVIPSEINPLKIDYFNILESEESTLKDLEIEYAKVSASNINDKVLIDFLKKNKESAASRLVFHLIDFIKKTHESVASRLVFHLIYCFNSFYLWYIL